MVSSDILPIGIKPLAACVSLVTVAPGGLLPDLDCRLVGVNLVKSNDKSNEHTSCQGCKIWETGKKPGRSAASSGTPASTALTRISRAMNESGLIGFPSTLRRRERVEMIRRGGFARGDRRRRSCGCLAQPPAGAGHEVARRRSGGVEAERVNVFKNTDVGTAPRRPCRSGHGRGAGPVRGPTGDPAFFAGRIGRDAGEAAGDARRRAGSPGQ